jgi:hypothetical protein
MKCDLCGRVRTDVQRLGYVRASDGIAEGLLAVCVCPACLERADLVQQLRGRYAAALN